MTVSRSVGAIIYDDASRLLLQHRDSKPDIFFPGYWGLFGGHCEEGEPPDIAIRREVFEELCINVTECEFFLQMEFFCQDLGPRPRHRRFYAMGFDRAQISQLRLCEGAGYEFFSVSALSQLEMIVPFDLAALMMFSHTRFLGRCIRPGNADQ